MIKGLVVTLGSALLFCAIIATPAPADSLTDSVTMTFFYPNTSTVYESPVVIPVGSSLACPGSPASFCSAYSEGGDHEFSVGTDTITYTASGDPDGNYSAAEFSGFDFSGLTFLSGNPLSSFNLTTDIAGLTASDVSFDPSDIKINVEGLAINGDFTLTLNPEGAIATPEPSTLVLLGTGLAGLMLMMFRRKMFA